MKNEGYINIQGWMFNELKLSGNELLLFALIYGFSQDGVSQYRGSISYIQKALSISRNTVIKTVNGLLEKGFITKEVCSTGNLYSAKTELLGKWVVQKLNRGSAENELPSAETELVSSAETEHNINNNTNHIINNNTYSKPFSLKELSLSGKQELSKKYNCSISDIDDTIETLINWCEAKGRKYKNYKSALQNWLMRNYGLRKKDYLKC
jgi:predicted DNA-binding transcriptional regulator